MLSLMPFTPRYAIFYAIYPKLCYRLCHIPRSSAIFFLNVMLQYITLTPSYANLSYAMFSGQSWGRILGYCCILSAFIHLQCEWFKVFVIFLYSEYLHIFTVWVVQRPIQSFLFVFRCQDDHHCWSYGIKMDNRTST